MTSLVGFGAFCKIQQIIGHALVTNEILSLSRQVDPMVQSHEELQSLTLSPDPRLSVSDNGGRECPFHKVKLIAVPLQQDGHKSAPSSVLESNETFPGGNVMCPRKSANYDPQAKSSLSPFLIYL